MKITNILYICSFLYFSFINLNLFSEEVRNGEIIYDVYAADFKGNTDKDLDKGLKDQLNRTNEEILKIQFKLIFNKSASYFEAIDKLPIDENAQNMGVKLAKIIIGTTEKYYKNYFKKENLKISERYGKKTVYELPFDEFDWILTKEFKIINGYKCYKAFTNVSQLNDVTNITKQFTPVVWYCPEIPINFGPRGLDGLPGLVIEASFNGTITYIASKITLNSLKTVINTNFKGERIKKVFNRKS